MADILGFNGITRLDGDPDRALESAKGQLASVIIIGESKDGGEFFYSSVASGPEALWHMMRAVKKLLDVPDGIPM